jgi:hypothetical protein
MSHASAAEVLHTIGAVHAGDAVIAPSTTRRTHVGHLLAKLEVRDRVQAVIFAYENGLVRPSWSDLIISVERPTT